MLDPKYQVPDFMFNVAQGFYDVGLLSANDPFRDKDVRGLQRIAVGAVNLSFAAELMLKGILLITSNQTTSGHELDTLFYKLRQDLQKQIEDRYKYYQEVDKDD